MSDLSDINCPMGQESCPIHKEINQLKDYLVELKKQVRTDSLTGLFNKPYLRDALETELERTSRTHQPTSLIMLDVDHFKKVNDTFGHPAGDSVLQHVARVIKSTLRKIDIPCRYGGEEFAIILPSTPLGIAAMVAERVREFIEKTPVEEFPTDLSVTASLGVSCYMPQMTASTDALIAQADRLLYKAKAGGRNQVCFEAATRTKTHVSADEKEALLGNPD